MSSPSLGAIDELLESAGLEKLNLVHDHPAERTVHKFENTIAGLAVLKVPAVFGVEQHAGS